MQVWLLKDSRNSNKAFWIAYGLAGMPALGPLTNNATGLCWSLVDLARRIA